MKKEKLLFLELLSCAVFGNSKVIEECDFSALESLAISHKCASLIAYGASMCKVKLPKVWNDAISMTVFNNYKNLSVQKYVIRLLMKNNIKCVVLKGITAAVNYYNPLSRAWGDIDILVEPKNYEKAMSLFGIVHDSSGNHFHFSFNVQNVSVEIHKSIDDYDRCLFGKELSKVMDKAMDNIQYIDFEGNQIPVLLPKYQAIVYLSHMIRHFGENELTVRMFCDWVAFTKKVDNVIWFKEVYPLIKHVGYEYYADALNLAAFEYFEANTLEKVVNKIQRKTVDALIKDFVYESKRDSSDFLNGNLVTEYANNSDLGDSFAKMSIRMLNGIARKEFYIAKYKITLPLCWVYIVFRYAIRVLFGMRNMVSYKKIKREVRRRNYLKGELHIN